VRDERGSIPLALALSLVAMSLSALLVPLVIGQLGDSREHGQRLVALNAAQTGLDVALAQVRAAAQTPDPDDEFPVGDLSKLPCGPFTGSVGGGNSSRYQVTIKYYSTDPQGKADAWLDDPVNDIDCVPGGGALATPKFAMLRAEGTDQASGSFTRASSRFLRATYTFQTSNQNIAGGLIPVYRASGTQFCMDAGSGSPVAGANLRIQPCSAGSAQQLFAYNQNLTIVLTSTQTPSNPLGMCLDAGLAPAAGVVVRFQQCGNTTLPQQQWSMNDESNLQGTTDGTNLNGRCFNVQSPGVAGSLVVMGTCGGGYSSSRTFQPEAAVGAGASGASAGQLVNFNQFGRCLDVTEFNVNKGYLINWPCKQAPDPSAVGWNQKFHWPSTPVPGQFWTANGSTRYCMQSPGSTARNNYVIFKTCTATTVATNLEWTVYRATDSYKTSYQVVDGFGNCLQPADPTETNPELYEHGNKVSKIVVRACNGSTLQKWNAPPNILRSLPLKDIGER
jgi:hypothetical protein